MMKRMMASTAALLCAALLLTCSALAVVPDGKYDAVSCEMDGTRYVCDGEYVTLKTDGTGEIMFNEHLLQATWEETDGALTIRDEAGGVFEGRFEPGTGLVGTYRGYEYVFEPGGFGAGGDPIAPAPDGEGESASDSLPAGTYVAVECVQDGTRYVCDGEYVTLNPDGTGEVVFNDSLLSLTWEATADGEIRFRDELGGEFEGGYDPAGELGGTYRGYGYTYKVGEKPETKSAQDIAPERWGEGLPCVFDQGGILTEEEIAELTAKATELSESYPCEVYIITVDDFTKYTNGSVERFAEDVRTGFDLGYGEDRDCIALILSMENRKYDIVIHGAYAHEIFPDRNREDIADKFLDNFKENDWIGGFNDYLDRCGRYLEGGGKLKVSIPAAIIGALVPSSLIGLIFCAVQKKKLQKVAEQTRAADYVTKEGCQFTYRSDRYTGTTVTRTYSPRSSGSGGSSSSGGGGHSHTSGSF